MLDLLEYEMKGKNDSPGSIRSLKPGGLASEVSGPVGQECRSVAHTLFFRDRPLSFGVSRV